MYGNGTVFCSLYDNAEGDSCSHSGEGKKEKNKIPLRYEKIQERYLE